MDTEKIQFGRRAVVGFGVGVPPQTIQEAATVSQGWGVPALMGAAVTLVSTYVGGVIGNLSAGDRHEYDPETVAGMTVLGMIGGAVVGGGVSSVVAARYGRRQDQAATMLAQTQQSST